MPGNERIQPSISLAGPGRRKSTRLDILRHLSSAIVGRETTLGSRGRKVTQPSKEKLQSVVRKASLRLREPSPKGQVKTKSRLPLSIDPKGTSSSLNESKGHYTGAPRLKSWLSHGLYVGQERDFDARYTETKNKLKRASRSLPRYSRRLILPLPMFAGQRTLDLGRDFELPFDIFSPLPAGQRKPEEWRKTQKNVFVGDAAQVWKVTKHQEASTCICQSESGCDESCFNRFMFYECDDSNCNIGATKCTNRSFEDLRQRYKAGGKYSVGVEVIKTSDRGYGVRSNRTFEPNQIIVEYAGEIITQDECDDRMRHRYKDNECYYLMSFDQNMIIDATRGSIARFVNHSCEPNCKMIKWTVAGKPRMALFAGDKGILTGEELTYDYNFDPFSSKNIQECRCNTPSCRGVLGPKPKDQVFHKSKDIKQALNPLITSGTKRRLQQRFGDSLEPAACKRRKLPTHSSIPSAFQSAQFRTSTQSIKASTLSSTKTKHDMIIRKASRQSWRALKSEHTVQIKSSRSNSRIGLTYTRRRAHGILGKAEPSEKVTFVSGRRDTRKAATGLRKSTAKITRRSTRSRKNGETIHVID